MVPFHTQSNRSINFPSSYPFYGKDVYTEYSCHQSSLIHLNEAMNDIPQPAPAARLWQWYAQGVRAAVLSSVRWEGLNASAATLAILTAISILLQLGLQRLYIDGPATFYWEAILSGWFFTAITAWVCYLMRPQPAAEGEKDAAPSAAHLFCMSLAQWQIIALITGLLYAVLLRNGIYSGEKLGADSIGESWLAPWTWVLLMWVIWLALLGWALLAQLTLLWRSGVRRSELLAVAALALIGSTALHYAAGPTEFWYAAEDSSTDAQRKELRLTQDLMEAQPQLLTRRLQEVQQQRPGVIDLYAISFAPYADEDVFRRESDMVSTVIAQRFDAQGRVLQLVNHVDTLSQWPWATPKNLERAIQRFATVMDRNEDVLFLHLTSHGARNGELAADFWPMSVTTVKPADLKLWLDAAGIKHRVISISACYSGSWIDVLADDNTLVMTAADAHHTSYGCGRKSELTYFGRAVYDEQLRNNTLSFEKAHATAREVIKKREEKAGKRDGYSNPQIKTGAAIRKHLAHLQERLETQASSKTHSQSATAIR